MPSMWLSDNQKIGVVFCVGGALFFTLGLILFFDRSMLAMGNLLLLIGLIILIGPSKSVLFFFQRRKLKGTIAFALGILLILFKWGFVGFIIESYGIFVLFGDFLSSIAGLVGAVPVVGPRIASGLRRLGGKSRGSELPV